MQTDNKELTFARLFGFGFLLWLTAAVLKWLAFSVFAPETAFVKWAYIFLILVFTVAYTRRTGVLNFFEALFIFITWLILSVISDSLVLSNLLGIGVSGKLLVWVGHLVMFFGIIIFHKKRHVEIRKAHGSKPLMESIYATIQKPLPKNESHGSGHGGHH